MKKTLCLLLSLLWLGASPSKGVVQEPSSEELVSGSSAICLAIATANRCFEKAPHSAIFTATDLVVDEAFKGTFADTLRIEHRGGELNGRGETYCGQPVFVPGTQYLLFLRLRSDGTPYSPAFFKLSDPRCAPLLPLLRQESLAGADLTGCQSPQKIFAQKNILPSTTGFSCRFLQGDRGEPIEYLIDMDSLPEGISTNQALVAVANAFATWSAFTSLTFEFAGIESFGMAAPDVDERDGRIRIQLHDNYNYIPPSSTVGRGGRSYSYDPERWPGGGLGGRVGTNEFDVTTYGFVVIEGSASVFSDPVTLEEVICHELGHVISLAHSSEDPNEGNATLSEATMYYKTHADGRGAVLAPWDVSTIQAVHPTNNTPPYGYDREIAAITSPTAPPFSSGANQVEIIAYDRQGGAVPVLLDENQDEVNGTFSLVGSNTVFFTPGGFFGDVQADPGGYYAVRYVRMDDGTNQSPPIAVRVVSFNADGDADLLQDSWANRFGVGGATADPDHDHFTNFEEWQIDSDPTNAASGLYVGLGRGMLSWSAKPNELYQVESTTNLVAGFVDEGNPIVATTTNEVLEVGTAGQKFYRVRRLK